MNLNEIRDLFPSHKKRELAEKAKVSYSEITRMFKGLVTSKTEIVKQEAVKILTEHRDEITKVLKQEVNN